MGVLSDRLRTRWGRRRPFILGGAVLTASTLVLLAWTEQIVRWVGCQGGFCGGGGSERGLQSFIVALAVLWTLVLSITVQPIQSGFRALMVDVPSPDQQSRASAWASRIAGAASIFSFFASSLSLPGLPGLGWLTQFQALACLNVLTLGITVTLTCVFIHEEDSRQVDPSVEQRSITAVFRHLSQTIRHLPKGVAQACKVQFCSWLAWFPLL